MFNNTSITRVFVQKDDEEIVDTKLEEEGYTTVSKTHKKSFIEYFVAMFQSEE